MIHDTPATILVADDDAATRTFLADELSADGFDPLVVESAADALRLLETKYPDLALLDIGLGAASGLEILRRLRAADGAVSRMDPDLPVLVLSGRCSEVDRVRAFECGADDFLAKPYFYGELKGRIGALLRRTERRRRPSRVRVGTLEIDPASRVVRLAGRPIDLTQKEFALLRVLAAAPTTVHTKQTLLRSVWGFGAGGTTRTLDSHACRLRGKLGAAGDRFVLNVWGVGYRLVDDPGSSAAEPEVAA
jgi:DNA-binding response OmpR family regulator